MARTRVAKILKAVDIAPAPERPTPWRTFLKAHAYTIAAADFFSSEVWTARSLVTHYVLFAVDLATRAVHIAGVTPNPDGAFMVQVARNLTASVDDFLHGKKKFIVGLELVSGERIAWPDLAAPLRSINEAPRIARSDASMCHGGHMSLIALSQGMFLPTPYWALIGPMSALNAGALQDSFKGFWEHLLIRSDVPAAVRSFRSVAGDTAFVQCEMLFGRLFMRYLLDAVIDPDGLDQRIERVHRESGGKAPREWIRKHLSDLPALQSHYRELHARYLWIDQFPEHGKQYTMTFADACRMFPNG